MESILKKIIDKLNERENEAFFRFEKGAFEIMLDRKPIDIIPIIESNFFYVFEIKKASPSKGILRENFNHYEIFNDYVLSGASAISVITEPEFFSGSKSYLSDLRKLSALPLLRKDFIIHPYQIYESYTLGADFVLLIAACLECDELKKLYELTLSLRMNALIEVHDEEDLEKALALNPRLIGINNRNLYTFEVDLNTSFRLKNKIPDSIFVVSESGIKSKKDIDELKKNGFAGVLVGESLLREEDIVSAAKGLIHD